MGGVEGWSTKWVWGVEVKVAGPGRALASSGILGRMATQGLWIKRVECWAKGNGLSFSKTENQQMLLLYFFINKMAI